MTDNTPQPKKPSDERKPATAQDRTPPQPLHGRRSTFEEALASVNTKYADALKRLAN